jgi:hypothetical protein
MYAVALVTAKEIAAIVGGPILVVLFCLWVAMFPEKVEKIGGWLWGLASKIWHRADRRAIALRVQGHVNSTTKRLLKHMPEGTVEGKIKLRWTNSDEARGVLRDGDVVVFMRRAQHHEENVAQALMVYLPKAVLSRARRYIEPTTMTAVDLTLAKAILGRSLAERGVLDVFYNKHLDPACEADEELSERVREMDEVDLHGWLLRVLIPEFRRLGDQLHPAVPDAKCRADADGFARWLAQLAASAPGDQSTKLSYEGTHFRVALVFVASAERLARDGIAPYRKVAKRLVYSGKFEAVYLMARDRNISAVKEIAASLQEDGRVDESTYFEFQLRPDFAKRKLDRTHAVVASLIPHGSVSVEQMLEENLDDLEMDRFSPAQEKGKLPFFEQAPAAQADSSTEKSHTASPPAK